VDVLPLIALFTMVTLPTARSPPATSPATLPLTVLRSMMMVLLKNP
jgi:hypothetical protein